LEDCRASTRRSASVSRSWSSISWTHRSRGAVALRVCRGTRSYGSATTSGRTPTNQEVLTRVQILVGRRSWLLLVALRWVPYRIRNQRQYLASRRDGGE